MFSFLLRHDSKCEERRKYKNEISIDISRLEKEEEEEEKKENDYTSISTRFLYLYPL